MGGPLCRCIVVPPQPKIITRVNQDPSSILDGKKFFDFGYGNATGFYDVMDRPTPDHDRTSSVSDDRDGVDGVLVSVFVLCCVELS